MSYGYDIGIYAGGISFTGKTYAEKPLGGSESSCVLLAEELVKLGNRVFVFTHGDEETYGEGSNFIYNGVNYLWYEKTFDQACRLYDWDIFLAERDYTKLINPNIRARQIGLINHDILTDHSIMDYLYTADFIYCLSEFHRNQYLNICPDLKNKISIIGNPLDVEKLNYFVEADIFREYSTFLYNSRPERGLLLLLKFYWPEVLKMYPNAQLNVCFYPVEKERLPDHIKTIHDVCYRLMEISAGVKFLGGLSKDRLYEEICSSTAIIYPCIFPEIFNISACESQILGTPYLTTNMFAMKENVIHKPHLVFGYEQLKEIYHRSQVGLPSLDYTYGRFSTQVKRVVEGKCEDVMYHSSQIISNKFDKKVIAEQFLEECRERFRKRSSDAIKGKRIIQNFIHHSDFLAAKWSCENIIDMENNSIVDFEYEKITRLLEKHHEDPEEYAAHVDNERFKNQEPPLVMRMEKALQWIEIYLQEKGLTDQPFAFLDCGPGGGFNLYHLMKTFPKAMIQAIDFSDGILEKARNLLEEKFKTDFSSAFIKTDIMEYQPEEQADIVLVGEVLEHCQDILGSLEKIFSFVKPGGMVIFTVPCGAWEILSNDMSERIFHVSHFERRDLEEIFREFDYKMELVGFQSSQRDNSIFSNWVIAVKKPEFEELLSSDPKYIRKFHLPNYQRKFETTRPYVKIGLTMICKNEEEHILGALKPLLPIVDHVVINDTGSTEKSLELIRGILKLQEQDNGEKNFLVQQKWTDHFAEARNFGKRILSDFDVDWILWQDFDERCNNPRGIRKYIAQGDLQIYPAFIIHQHQILLDMPQDTRDIPVRLFRADKGFKWYRRLHEQVQPSENGIIGPTLILPDVEFLHYGYLNEYMRRTKVVRNYRIMELEHQESPNSHLGNVLYMRDLIQIVQWHLEKNIQLEENHWKILNNIVQMNKKFADEEHPLHFLADIFYQNALKYFGEFQKATDEGQIPIQAAILLRAGVGGLSQNENPQIRWFATIKEMEKYLLAKQKKFLYTLSQIPDPFSWE